MPNGDPRFAEDDGGGLVRGTIVRDIAGGAGPIGVNSAGQIIFSDPSTGQAFRAAGWFRLPDGKWFELDSTGQVIDGPRSLTTVEERHVLSGRAPFGAAAIAGAGTTGLSFEQRRQLEEEARGFSAEEAEKQRQFQLKRDAAAEATSLIQQQTGLREQARNLATELFGRDVIRGGLAAQGALSIGQTPQRAFEEQLRGVAAEPIPEPLGAEATLVQQEEQAAGLRRTVQGGLPRQQPGFAGGTEGTGHGMLVGEAGPEVVEFTPQGTVRVIPLTRKAQGGLEEFDPFERTAPAIARGLEPVFRHLGFDDPGLIPLGQSGAEGQALSGAFGSFGGAGLSLQPGRAAETFGMLGVRPALLQAAGTDEFFFRSPEGEIQKIGGLLDVQRIGLNPEEATALPLAEIGELGQFGGERLTEAPPAELRPFAQRATPLRMPLSVDDQGLPDRSGPSIFLPAPRQLAGVWRTLDPDTKGLLQSAWQISGLSPEQAARELGFFTPRGTASQFATAALR